MQSEGKAWEVGANDTGSITNERSIEQEEENIPHSPSKEEASSFVAAKEEINHAAKKEDNCIVIDDSQSGKSEWPTSWIPSHDSVRQSNLEKFQCMAIGLHNQCCTVTIREGKCTGWRFTKCQHWAHKLL